MKESETQSDIMDMLLTHPKVCWAMVITTGVFKVKGGCITVGHYMSDEQKQKTGMSDIVGMLKNGKFFSIETKVPGKEPTEVQYEFMDLVNRNGGLAFWADSVSKAMYGLNEGDSARLEYSEK